MLKIIRVCPFCWVQWMHGDTNMSKCPVTWSGMWMWRRNKWITTANQNGASIISHLWSSNFDLKHESTGSLISFASHPHPFLFANLFTGFLMEMQLDNRTFENRKVCNGIKCEWSYLSAESSTPFVSITMEAIHEYTDHSHCHKFRAT